MLGATLHLLLKTHVLLIKSAFPIYTNCTLSELRFLHIAPLHYTSQRLAATIAPTSKWKPSSSRPGSGANSSTSATLQKWWQQMGQLCDKPNADAAIAVRSEVAALVAPVTRGRGRPTICTAARPPSHPHWLGEKESETSTNFKPCFTPSNQNLKQI